MNLDQVDLERGGDYLVRSDGEVRVLPSARDLNWRQVVTAIKDKTYFGFALWPAGAPLASWKLDVVHEGWIRHNGLTTATDTSRLVLLMERYYEGIEYDLRARLGERAGDLWRERRWRELLGYIVSLPGDTRMNYLLSQDEEYLEHVLRDQDRTPDTAPSGPSMADWSLTASLLAQLIDAVRTNTEVTKAAGGGKPSQVRPVQRPVTAVDRIQNRMQRQAHQEMSAILLRNRPDRAGGTMNGSQPPAE